MPARPPAPQLNAVVPSVLLPVLPHLADELAPGNPPEARLAAVELLGRLFSQPGGGDLAREYPALFEALVKRLQDQEVSAQ